MVIISAWNIFLEKQYCGWDGARSQRSSFNKFDKRSIGPDLVQIIYCQVIFKGFADIRDTMEALLLDRHQFLSAH
jgi:hypothetical protein